jgi:hypothetical protein
MKAEILKANSFKDNISVFFKNLSARFIENNNLDITVIVNQAPKKDS